MKLLAAANVVALLAVTALALPVDQAQSPLAVSQASKNAHKVIEYDIQRHSGPFVVKTTPQLPHKTPVESTESRTSEFWRWLNRWTGNDVKTKTAESDCICSGGVVLCKSDGELKMRGLCGV